MTEFNEGIIFRKKVGAKNRLNYLTLPDEISEYLGIQPGTPVVLEPKNGKFGKYVVMYIEPIKEVSSDDTNSETTE